MSKKAELPIWIRKANQEDVNFIFNSWLKSFRGSLFAKPLNNTVYFTEHHKILERIAKTSEILIACNKDDPTQIYGYICAERVEGIFVLHYAYIKHTYRSMGIAKILLSAFERDPEEAGCYTHHTRSAERLAPKFNLIYHPYLLINHEQEESEDVSSAEVKD